MNTVVALCAPEGVPGSVFTSRADPPSMPEPGLWGNPQATHPSCCTSRAPDMSAGPFCAPSMVHSRLYGTPMSFDRSCAVAIRWKTFQSQLSVVMQRPCADAVLHAAAQKITWAPGLGRRHVNLLRPHHSMRRPYVHALGEPHLAGSESLLLILVLQPAVALYSAQQLLLAAVSQQLRAA